MVSWNTQRKIGNAENKRFLNPRIEDIVSVAAT